MASRRRRFPPRFPQDDGFDWMTAIRVGLVMIVFAVVFLILVYKLMK